MSTSFDGRTRSTEKILTSAGTAERLIGTSTLVTRLIMTAKLVDAVNTGSAFWGDTTVEYSVLETGETAPGESFEINSPEGECFDLYDIYVDAAVSGDGFVFNYLPA